MNKKTVQLGKNISPRKAIPWIMVLIVAAIIVLLPVGGFVFAANQESHDTFCGSCHTQPESTYLQRSIAAQPVDLASYHTTQDTKCIDCHSGQGLGGRMQAEMLGAYNAFKWYTGMAIQPAPLTQPIGDANCLKCHQQVTERGYQPQNQTPFDIGEAPVGHWHQNLASWQAQTSNAGTCNSCHTGHTTDADGKMLFLNQPKISAVCASCHQTLGGGD